MSLPLAWLVLVGIGSPAVLLAILGGASFFGRPLSERWTAMLTGAAMLV